MAMNVGGGGGGGEPEVMVEMNTTPLIDVMLVLLIMLILTIPIQMHAVGLNLPSGKPPAAQVQPKVVQIDIDFDGTISWNGAPVDSNAQLSSLLVQAAHTSPQPEIHVRPNKLVPYRVVAGLMAMAQRDGITKLGLVGNDQFANAS